MMQYNDRNRKLLQWAVPITLIVGLAICLLFQTWDSMEERRIKAELLSKYAKQKPPPMVDPFTGRVAVKITAIRAIQKAVARGEHKAPKLITSYDFCGDGNVTKGVWTEIEALKKAQKKAQAKLGKNVCLHITSSCRTHTYQDKIWRKYWVYKDGKVVLKPDGNPLTSIVVAPPGHSFHEFCRGFDISNFQQVQKFLWDEGFAGGSRGLTGDYVHFSRGGEFTNADMVSWRNAKNLADIYIARPAKKYVGKPLGRAWDWTVKQCNKLNPWR